MTLMSIETDPKKIISISPEKYKKIIISISTETAYQNCYTLNN
jgi:hypothetical protein